MKKITLFLTFLLSSSLFMAQSNEIAYWAKVEDPSSLLDDRKKENLRQRVEMIVLAYGTGTRDLSRFGVTCSLVDNYTELVSANTVIYNVKGSFKFTVVDFTENRVIKGAMLEYNVRGNSESDALLKAIKSINQEDPRLKEMFELALKDIKQYYDQRCNSLLANAETSLGAYKFDKAIYELLSIPDFCTECKQKANARATEIYMASENYKASESLQKAKVKWASSNTVEGANQVGDILSTVNPEASCIADINAFIVEVQSEIKKQFNQDWDYKWAKDILTPQMKIDATKEVGVAYGKNQVCTIFTTGK
jgi:hypothetical protein